MPGNLEAWPDGCGAADAVAETDAGGALGADEDEGCAGAAALALAFVLDGLPPAEAPPMLLAQPEADTGAITGATMPAGAEAGAGGRGAALAAGADMAALEAAEPCASLATVPLAPVAGSAALPVAEPIPLCEPTAESVGASPAGLEGGAPVRPGGAAVATEGSAAAEAGEAAAGGAGGASAAVGGGGGAWPRYERSPLSPVDPAGRPPAGGGAVVCPADVVGLKAIALQV